MSRPTVRRSFCPWSMRENLARLVLSQSCSLFLSVVSLRLRIISLMLSFRAAISPWASSAIERVRSPLVTAVATSAMARTCVVRLAASWLTLSVRSFHVPAAPGTLALRSTPPSPPTRGAGGGAGHAGLASQLPFDADEAGDGGHLVGERGQRLDHAIDRVGQLGDFPLGF